MSNPTVCRTKVHYDSEFEATIAATKMEDKFGDEMVPYFCNGHYHLTHKNRQLRRGVGKNHQKCKECGDILKISRMYKHNCRGRR